MPTQGHLARESFGAVRTMISTRWNWILRDVFFVISIRVRIRHAWEESGERVSSLLRCKCEIGRDELALLQDSFN